MKKNILLTSVLLLSLSAATYAADTVFDSMGNATEVKLAPAISTKTNSTNTSATKASSTTSIYSKGTIKEQKFSNAIVNLDDAQVELRQELAEKTERYNAALQEKERAIQNCRALKKELNTINKNMKNIEKAKRNINKNLES
ncbi:MAG: hypothetical protein IKR34_06625 [Candidatus Gastranaerophilales bacterium]|nr:hypothetical protein [Candidatus Gastranaerophilales bacterium]